MACLVGIILCCYPFVNGIVQRQFRKEAVATYKKGLEKGKNLDDTLQKAAEYNDVLCQVGNALVGNAQNGILSSENYEGLLNPSGNGIMGVIKIPKINVNLPIYHGTAEEAISNGAGHLEGSSLPVGGENTRCILTSHRGLPNGRLFTRLDELEREDYIFLEVCNQTLAYQVNEIEVIEPEELDKLYIRPEEDLLTLVTCTPYGINTQRLVITGERVPYEEGNEQKILPKMYSVRELVFTMIPIIVLLVFLWKGIKRMMNKKRYKDEKE